MKILFIWGCIVLLTACSSAQTNRAYQDFGRSENFKLDNSLIIGLEKASIKDTKNVKSRAPHYEFLNKPNNLSSNEKRVFELVFENQKKVMIPTQIAFQEAIGPVFTYNIYNKKTPLSYDYKRSFIELSNAFHDLENKLKVQQYTHILVMSMGWNNNQAESIYRYNKIRSHLLQASDNADDDFNPFIIGFTWPSVWLDISSPYLKKLAHGSSYFNKSNDADEIGFTWANLVLNHFLPNSLKELQSPPKVVIIGHSMGARLLSRALFSKMYLNDEFQSDFEADLFLGLQGAFSLNRFGNEGSISGLEGSPYRDFSKMQKTEFILTSSKGDAANPWAFWSCHAGSASSILRSGLDCIKGNNSFNVVRWLGKSNQIPLTTTKKQVLMVDASLIVCKGCDGDSQISDGHNDVLDQDMSDLMWNFIQQLEK